MFWRARKELRPSACLSAEKITKKDFNPFFRRPLSFVREESGGIAIMFSLAIIPIILMIGAGIDYSLISLERAQVQDAIDAAALAAVKQIGKLDDEEVATMIDSFVAANVPESSDVTIESLDIDRAEGSIVVNASESIDTTFMRIGGIDNVSYSVSSTAVTGDKTMEVVMVLDNSTSMTYSMSSLRKAAASLVDILEESSTDGNLSVGLVPFTHLVRLDKAHLGSSWLDTDARSSIHRNNLPSKSNRFDLFATLTDPTTRKAEEWEGCMEARPYPYDVNDEAAKSSNPDTYFVPYFYPDTHESNNRYYASYNLYLPETSHGHGPGWGHQHRQSYSETKEYGGYYEQTMKNNGNSPNKSCEVSRLTPLSTDLDTVRTNISAMSASGSTDIHMGTIWGLRLLSPHEPYTEGRSYSEDTNQKFLIIMTDGNNYYSGYGSHGWAADGRLSGSSTVVNEMNSRTLESCEAAWDAGVQVYTIAYGSPSGTTRAMLKSCAKYDDNYFDPDSQSELVDSFEEIAGALTTLRLTK